MEYLILGFILGLLMVGLLRPSNPPHTISAPSAKTKSFKEMIEDEEWRKEWEKTHRLTNLYMGKELKDEEITEELLYDIKLLRNVWVKK